MSADGSELRILAGDTTGGTPAWSPDGRTIAFKGRRDGNTEIYVVNADGSGQRRLTSNTAGDYFPHLVTGRAEDRLLEPARRQRQSRDLRHERRRDWPAELDAHGCTGGSLLLVTGTKGVRHVCRLLSTRDGVTRCS
jgi:hypothetical protein